MERQLPRNSMDHSEIVEQILNGGIGILPTDTVYGIVGSAFESDAVERIYQTKKRDHRKPLIVLIGHIDDVERFGVVLNASLRLQLSTYWPGPYSIILPTIDEQFEYLHRGTDAIAFRLPENDDLLQLISETGPLVAPSANPEGHPPATSIPEARLYFGDEVDFYLDNGVLDGKPSTLLRYNDGEFAIVRE